MGAVFLGSWKGHDVAVKKILSTAEVNTPDVLENFFHEIDLIRHLSDLLSVADF